MWHLKCEYEAIYVRIFIYDTHHPIYICASLHSLFSLLLSRNSFHIFCFTASADPFVHFMRLLLLLLFLFLLFISTDLSLCMLRITVHLLLFSMFLNIIEIVWFDVNCNNFTWHIPLCLLAMCMMYVDER